jgi:DUF1680 family protein
MKQLFKWASLSSIQPAGWYKNQLRIQAKGITGIIDRYWDPLKDNSGWLGGDGESWERGPYYLDGLLPLAWLLNDEELKQKAQRWIEWTLASQGEDGNFGPKTNNDSWPRSVMLKCLIQYEGASGDTRVYPFILKYLSYLTEYIAKEGLHVWGWARGEELLVSVMWAYERGAEPWLKELAHQIITASFNWLDYYSQFPYPRPTSFYYDWKQIIDKLNDNEIYGSAWYHGTHGVNVAMGYKMALLQAFFTDSADPTNVLLEAVSQIQVFHGTANGIYNCTEHLAGNDPAQGVELCAIVEYMYSLETMLHWSSNVNIADILETVAYNALPASMTFDMRGHQYLQQTNQIMCNEAEHRWYNNKNDANVFGLEPHYGCCTANLHQGWPKLNSAFWMYSGDGGIVSSVFAPCVFSFTSGDGKKCTINEITDYPFDERITYVLSCEETVDFSLQIRIPSWCEKALIKLPGGKTLNPPAGRYYTLKGPWKDGDRIEVCFPFTLRLSHWRNNSVSLSYGPLVLSLTMDEKWTAYKGGEPFPYWEVYTSSKWNYALLLDNDSVRNVKISRNSIAEQPYTRENPPFIVEVPAKHISSWTERDNGTGPLPLSPVPAELCSNEIEMIKLIPYGAAKLRITQFPYVMM